MHAIVGSASLRGSGNGNGEAAIPTDETLIESIANQDETAMKLLFERHNVRVFRFVVRLTGRRELAEDVVSDVFFDVWRTAAAFEGRCQVSTWLLSIARHKVFATLRKRSPQALDDEFAKTIPDPAEGPESATNATQEGALLRRCLTALPADDRELLDLAYYHEKTTSEIARIVGIPAGTVKSRLFAVRRRVADLLGEAGLTPYRERASANAK
jgi:RNA polymerase sigma-70 factor, ECF subfamily